MALNYEHVVEKSVAGLDGPLEYHAQTDNVEDVVITAISTTSEVLAIDVSDPEDPVIISRATLTEDGTFGIDTIDYLALGPDKELGILTAHGGDGTDQTHYTYLIDYHEPDSSTGLGIFELDRITVNTPALANNPYSRRLVAQYKIDGLQGMALFLQAQSDGTTNIETWSYDIGGFVSQLDSYDPSSVGLERSKIFIDEERQLLWHHAISSTSYVLELFSFDDAGLLTKQHNADVSFGVERRAYAVDHSRELYFFHAETDLFVVETDGSSFTVLGSSSTGFGHIKIVIDEINQIAHLVRDGTDQDSVQGQDISDATDTVRVDRVGPGPSNAGGDLIRPHSHFMWVAVQDETLNVATTNLTGAPEKPVPSVEAVYDGAVITATYSHPGGVAHSRSRYQIREADETDWSDPHHDSDWTTEDLEFHKATPDDIGDYEARVAHRDENDAVAWSDPVAFTMTRSQSVPAGDGGPLGTGDDDREDPLYTGTA